MSVKPENTGLKYETHLEEPENEPNSFPPKHQVELSSTETPNNYWKLVLHELNIAMLDVDQDQSPPPQRKKPARVRNIYWILDTNSF